MVVRAKVVADTVSQLLRGQDSVRFGYRSLAMYPLGLDVVQPGALGRQKARDDLHALLAVSPIGKHSLIVLPYPVAHLSADVPGGIVPDEHQHSLAFLSQPLAHPLQVGGAHMAHRSSINEAQKHLTGVFPQQPITANSTVPSAL